MVLTPAPFIISSIRSCNSKMLELQLPIVVAFILHGVPE